MCPPCNLHASQTKQIRRCYCAVWLINDCSESAPTVSTFFRIPTPHGIFAKPSEQRTGNLTLALSAEACIPVAMQAPSNRTECDKNSSDPRHLRPRPTNFCLVFGLRRSSRPAGRYKIVRTSLRRREIALRQNQSFAGRVRVDVITTKHVGPRAGRKGTRQGRRKAPSQDAAR